MSSSPFLNFIRHELRLRGYSLKTEKSYLYWIKYFIRFHKLQHPQNMGAEEVRAFLSFLAVEKNVAINTQKSALNALAFLYNKLLDQPLGDLGFQHAKQGRRLPIVLMPNEIQKILGGMNERDHLIFSLFTRHPHYVFTRNVFTHVFTSVYETPTLKTTCLRDTHIKNPHIKNHTLKTHTKSPSSEIVPI